MSARRWVQSISQNGNSTTVVLPRALAHELGLTKGQPVALTIMGSSIVLTPLEDVVKARVAADMVKLSEAAAGA